MTPAIDREKKLITFILDGISRNVGEIQVLLTRSRTYDIPMANSLGCPSTKLEEIRGNKAMKLDSSDNCKL